MEKHKVGCWCPECMALWDQRIQASRQLFSLLGLAWLGPRQAMGVAQMIREGQADWLPPKARMGLRALSPDVLSSLLRDILE